MQILAYAIDVVIVGRYENAVKDAFSILEMEAQKMGLIDYAKQNVWSINKREICQYK